MSSNIGPPHSGLDAYAASGSLPKVLFRSARTAPTPDRATAFNEAVGTNLSHWEFLDQGIEQPDGTIPHRPELDIYSLAMLGGGRVLVPPLCAGTWPRSTLFECFD